MHFLMAVPHVTQDGVEVASSCISGAGITQNTFGAHRGLGEARAVSVPFPAQL